MLSASFVFKQLTSPESSERITKVSWNRNDGWLALGGENGMMRILMIESVDSHDFNLQGVAARPSRVSVDRRVSVHEGARVTSVGWNECAEQVTSGDVRGSVVVCEYKEGRWQSILVNESVQSPVVAATWAADGSKILILYQSGQLLLGAATGHKILSMQIQGQETPKFAKVADSRNDFFIVGFDAKIICYNFDGSERYKIALGPHERLSSGYLAEFQANRNGFDGDAGDTSVGTPAGNTPDPRIIVTTASGALIIFCALTGERLARVSLVVAPTDLDVSPNNQYVAVSGSAGSQGSSSQDSSAGAAVQILRLTDLASVALVELKAKLASCVAWDASGLRLAVGADDSVFLACLRPSYRQQMLRDGTVAFSLGSALIRAGAGVPSGSGTPSDAIVPKSECIVFFKNSFNKRWPEGFVDQVACGDYLAVVSSKSVVKNDGNMRIYGIITFYTSVGAPVTSLDLTFVPTFIAGSGHYLVVSNAARLALFDVRYLTGETRDFGGVFAQKGETYSGVVEWHADGLPTASDRELQAARAGVSSPITALAAANTALFIARANGEILRYALPSLQKLQAPAPTVSFKALRANCAGTALAGIDNSGRLRIVFCPDFVAGPPDTSADASKQPKLSQAERRKRLELKAASILNQKNNQKKADNSDNSLGAMLGLDGDISNGQSLGESGIAQDKNAPPPSWDPDILDVWGCIWNDVSPGLLAVSSRHKIFVLDVKNQQKEEPITASAHLLTFSGLELTGIYLDEMVMYGEPRPGALRTFDTQPLRGLKEALYGSAEAVTLMDQEKALGNLGMPAGNINSTGNCLISAGIGAGLGGDAQESLSNDLEKQANIPQALQYLKQLKNPHEQLWGIVAGAALRTLALDVASDAYLRAGDYCGYHFVEHVRRLASDELRKAEVAVFLGDFAQADFILLKQLGRPDAVQRYSRELCMWLRIVQWRKGQDFGAGMGVGEVSDELAGRAYKEAGLYYLRNRQYQQAIQLLEKAGLGGTERQREDGGESVGLSSAELLVEALFHVEAHGELAALTKRLSAAADAPALRAAGRALARLGDAGGAADAFLRLNQPREAVRLCVALKAFDLALKISEENNVSGEVEEHLGEYLKQLLASGDEKAALDLLRRTNRGELAAAVIVGAAFEEFKAASQGRLFPLRPGAFSRLRRLVVLAAREASEAQRRRVRDDLRGAASGDALLTAGVADKTLDGLMKDAAGGISGVPGAQVTSGGSEDTAQIEDADFIASQRLLGQFGGRVRPASALWRLVRQTRWLVLSSYMLFMGKPEQALYPAVEASGYYHRKSEASAAAAAAAGEEGRMLENLALPIAALAALQAREFQLASALLETLEADETLPPGERDQLQQMSVDVFSKFPIEGSGESDGVGASGVVGSGVPRLQCGRCRGRLGRYAAVCGCGWTASLCARTGQPVAEHHSVQRCSVCGSVATQGRAYLQVCPMCHAGFAQ